MGVCPSTRRGGTLLVKRKRVEAQRGREDGNDEGGARGEKMEKQRQTRKRRHAPTDTDKDDAASSIE